MQSTAGDNQFATGSVKHNLLFVKAFHIFNARDRRPRAMVNRDTIGRFRTCFFPAHPLAPFMEKVMRKNAVAEPPHAASSVFQSSVSALFHASRQPCKMA